MTETTPIETTPTEQLLDPVSAIRAKKREWYHKNKARVLAQQRRHRIAKGVRPRKGVQNQPQPETEGVCTVTAPGLSITLDVAKLPMLLHAIAYAVADKVGGGE